jgi:tetratricopeptide (TPR) repeat protein
MKPQHSVRITQQRIEAEAESLALREQEKTARERGDSNQLAAVLCQLGTVYHKYSLYDEAISYLQEAEELMREAGDKEMLAGILNNSGIVYASMEQNEEAIFSLEEALFIVSQLQDMNSAAMMCENISDLYIKLERFSEAIQQMEKSLDYYRQVTPLPSETLAEIEQKLEQCRAQQQAETTASLGPIIAAVSQAEIEGKWEQAYVLSLALGDIYYVFEQDDKALANYQKVCARITTASPYFACAWHTLGNWHYAHGEIETAMTCLSKAKAAYRAQELHQELALCLNDLGSCYQALRQGEQAEACYGDAMSLAENQAHTLTLAAVNDNYASLLESDLMNEPLRALAYYEKAIAGYQKAKVKERANIAQEKWKICKERTEI